MNRTGDPLQSVFQTYLLPGTEFIVDNLDMNTRQTGTWTVSSGLNPYSSDSVYSNDGTFTWEPDLPASGTYNVYAWWTYRQNRSTTVPYRIAHDDGTAIVIVDQHDQALDGRWNFLGTYTFTPGMNGEVTVSSENGQANADAVRFVSTALAVVPLMTHGPVIGAMTND